MSKRAIKNPLALLLGHQRSYVEDDARFKIWLASRQVGKSFAAACEVVVHCHKHPGTMWVILSAGERQALEFMEKVKQWVRAFDLVLADEKIERVAGTESLLKSAEIRLPNGSRIVALPANADTARGYSANLVLDEFAFHKDPEALWRAVYPTITNPLRGELKVRVLSTPNGQGNKFYDLWTDDTGVWSKHKTTIHDAVAGGLKVDVDALKKAVGDGDGWRQEYECEFIDSSRVAFPYELLALAESPEASLEWPAGHDPLGPLYVGIDVGSISDPTACVTLERIGMRLIIRERVLLKGMALSDQDAVLEPRIQRAAGVSIDASGLGLDLAQRLVRRHGGKVIAQPVTAKWKREALSGLQNDLRDGLLSIPSSRELREDFHAWQVNGAGESASFHAPRTDAGHSDTTMAVAHGRDAARKGAPPGTFGTFDLTGIGDGRNYRRTARACIG